VPANDIAYYMLFFMDIKTIRGKWGLTQEELARRLGVSWGTVARWEAGKSKPSKLSQKAIEDFIKDSEKKGVRDRSS